jgi:heterokaryon incompatibility protein (HET)
LDEPYDITPQLLQIQPRLAGGLSVRLAQVRRMIDTCTIEHDDREKPPRPKPLRNMKVIDCMQHRVVEWAGQEYAALSYCRADIWGLSNSAFLLIRYGELPTKALKRPGDALSLAHQLGIRYLWVDIFCINQSNSEEKTIQLQYMDRIYSNARITIAFANGKQFERVSVPKMSLFAQHPSAIAWIHFLKCYRLFDNHNGIPEAGLSRKTMLSRRILIYANSKFLWQCSSVMDIPDSEVDSYISLPRVKFLDNKITPIAEDILNIIKQYSKRKLSHPEDRLNAILGVLNTYESNGSGF